MKQLRVSFSFPFSTLHTASVVAPAVVKVVLSDGTVHESDDSSTVAELMLEHQREVVVEFDSEMTISTTVSTGRSHRRLVPLPADRKLEAGKVYMMLPLKRGKSLSLTSEEARHVLLNASTLLKQSSSSPYKFVPLFARACTAGSIGGHREGNFVKLVKKETSCDEQVMKVVKRTDCKRLVSFFEEEDEEEEDEENKVPEYLSRQLSGKGWKPTLDTIKEKKIEQQKLPHWLF
ncbi:unnamed protein product [Linum tenue]|uniref:Uncharacterized protein n=1 Tax=Linum tenue TaxID=586396 RepID=A0AAV0IQH5_9ROSI|nr:unnamed protein product [Linum tenue]